MEGLVRLVGFKLIYGISSLFKKQAVSEQLVASSLIVHVCASRADEIFTSELFTRLGAKSWDDFYKKTVNLDKYERISIYREAWDDIVQANTGKNGTWEYKKDLSKRNKRDVYYDTKTKKYYALDTQHGTIEVHGKNLKGEGEYLFSGKKNKDNVHILKK